MKIFKLNLVANAPVDLVVSGDFFRILQAASDVSVSIDSSDFLEIAQGLSIHPGRYERLRVLSSTSQSVRIICGMGRVDDSRISLSAPVSVIDGGKQESMNGLSFLGSMHSQPGAGNRAGVYLWNPPVSGKRVILWMAQASSDLNSQIVMETVDVQAGALFGQAFGSSKLAQDGTVPVKSVIQVNGRWSTVALETDISQSAFVSSFSNYQRNFKEPVILMPGTGYAVISLTTAVVLRGSFEWSEEDL